ncbi:MAG: sigma-70 family RNA polymerase sigma factor [Clostridiales bacterium]|nr:sigma-70 family RNA polymerase sigma factor [Clostridiales bacterium]
MEPFEDVYDRYFRDVFQFAYSMCGDAHLAEEITQETFFKALQQIDRFRGECSVKSWLFQIARNHYLSRCRKDRHLTSLEDTPELVQTGSVEERLLDRESAMELHRKLHRLPEPYREVFSLRVFGELSFADIGDLFGKSDSWARVTFYRARCKLKEEST